MYSDTEGLARPALRELQGERLRETVARAYENVPFYRTTLDEAGVHPSDIESVDEVTRLPMTTTEDFADEFPDGLFAVEQDSIRRFHASSGTTGKPKIVAYTEADLALWADVMARSLAAAGVQPGDTVQNAYGYGLFTGGLGFHDGAEALGAAVVPTSSGGTQRQVELARDLESTVLACTPSYALYFSEQAADMGVEPSALSIDAVTYGAETCTEPMREEIEEALGATGINNYGLSEIVGPGVAVECHQAQDGLHIWEDHFYPEVVDPHTGEALPEGEEGELVLTTLTKEALPLLRYRTGDLTALTTDGCACGRTMVRMANLTGRTDDLLVVRGINFYPSEIEYAVLEFDAVAPHYQIELRTVDNMDEFRLCVELAEDVDEEEQAALHEALHSRLSNVLGFTPDHLTLVAPGTIERTAVGKVQRVFDYRG